uniref:bL33m n=1 Tax=Polytomella magna TaxID=353565 RepID=UPI002240E4D8|nr:Chain AA, bL33m [Polytomella magna]8APN_AA Chain AA, bL33m [Polytomella magna]8APO_AA Chain AA, bL33m [Polytomella magna]
RLLVKMVSLAKTGYFYVTTKNPRNTPWKLKLMKFDPVVGRHVLFEESKLK